jgi:hypothetical protein
MNVLFRLLVSAVEGAVLGFLVTLFHAQFWPDDLTPPQERALIKANWWVVAVLPIFAMIVDWRINLPMP